MKATVESRLFGSFTLIDLYKNVNLKMYVGNN